MKPANPTAPLQLPDNKARRSSYCCASDSRNLADLRQLERRMRYYYTSRPYHTSYIRGINAQWSEAAHPAQIRMCSYIAPGNRVLEVGCGDGSGEREISSRISGAKYIGLDLNPSLWGGRSNFVAGVGTALPFDTGAFEIVVSMFVLEHIVFPHIFLDEMWRVLAPGGRILLIAPDFLHNAMASEWIGLSYGSGREKLRKGRIADALVTLLESRVRYAWKRWRRKGRITSGRIEFPILLEPRCLHFEDFVPDCDAVYQSCPEEVTNYLRRKGNFGTSRVFYRNQSTFGLVVEKN
jgi:SAM-dependent methyltransferase